MAPAVFPTVVFRRGTPTRRARCDTAKNDDRFDRLSLVLNEPSATPDGLQCPRTFVELRITHTAGVRYADRDVLLSATKKSEQPPTSSS